MSDTKEHPRDEPPDERTPEEVAEDKQIEDAITAALIQVLTDAQVRH
jgi:hypothetical protein